MRPHPDTVLGPIFDWLDRMIAEHGHLLFVVFLWLSIFVIAWIIGGGLRWRASRNGCLVVRSSSTPPPVPVEPPPLPPSADNRDDDYSQSFAA
jgi:hypothetical protein